MSVLDVGTLVVLVPLVRFLHLFLSSSFSEAFLPWFIFLCSYSLFAIVRYVYNLFISSCFRG